MDFENMSKTKVESAPKSDLSEFDIHAVFEYMQEYGVTNAKGEYLHWSKLKWSLPTGKEEIIWAAIQFKRMQQMKILGLVDPKKIPFRYCIPESIEAKLHQVIEVAGGNVGAVGNSPISNHGQNMFLFSSLIMEEAISSAQLEGAATTREVAKKMLEEDREPINEDERMILNNFLLLKQAERSSKDPLTVDLILEFHLIATQGTTGNNNIPGEFRNSDDIYVGDGDDGISYQPPSHELIKERLQALCDFANEDHSGRDGRAFIAPVVKAIILHFMIGYEHPFRDGNGRTARAIFYWFMLKHEYNLFKYVSISKLIKASAKKYGLSYLYSEKDANDLTYFIDFQLDIIIQSFDDLKKYLEEKSKEFNQVVRELENTKFSSLCYAQKEIIKKATKSPGRVFTVKEIASDYDISGNTARKYLKELVTHRLLLPTNDGRLVYYVAPADLRQRLLSA